MSFVTSGGSRTHPEFVLIGNPVAHSLSPAMHNALYEELGKTRWPFAQWHYRAICCPDEQSALHHIELVRTGRFRGMNVTTPFKRLAFECADLVDASADVAGGANVLVRDADYRLCAYNTDGKGVIGAIERVSKTAVAGKRVMVCGTGPTSCAAAAAAFEAGAVAVLLVSRSKSRARSAIHRMLPSLDPQAMSVFFGMDYEQANQAVGDVDIIVEATPCGMHEDDASLLDVRQLHAGQLVLDTVYGQGPSKLVEDARSQGALAFDGIEMLVEQAALSVEIWANEMALPVKVDRGFLRRVVRHHYR